jgi:hypothetical protein
VFDAAGKSVLADAIALAGGPKRVITLSDPAAAHFGVKLSQSTSDRAPGAVDDTMRLLADGQLRLRAHYSACRRRPRGPWQRSPAHPAELDANAHTLSFADARPQEDQMETPIEAVRRFCAAWSDNMGAVELAAFFTEDAVYHNIPLAPVTGREDIANTISSVLRPGPPGIEAIDFRVIGKTSELPALTTLL